MPVAGIDYSEREAKAVEAIKQAIPSALKQDLVPESKGFFVELYENNEVFPKHYCATAVDGVGTKLLLAQLLNKYDTIGIDCVAMNANDMAVLGSVSPFLFLDYLACQAKIEEEGLTGAIMKGVVKGLEQCNASKVLRNSIHVNLGKGETASLDEIIVSYGNGYGFDLAGSMIGFIPKDEVYFSVSPGDKIIALRSSGPHSNGYTALRTLLLKGDFEQRKEYRARYKGRFSVESELPGGNGETVGEALLEPTKIYTRVMATLSRELKVVGVNNTGYGLKNFNRLGQGIEYRIQSPLEPHQVFDVMKRESGYSMEKMYEKFNMGQGFFVIVKPSDVDRVLSIVEKQGEQASVIGEARKVDGENRVVLEAGGEKLVFKGY